MIKYQLYDRYGKKVHEELTKANNCGTIILCYNEEFYRPIHYDLISVPHIAKCVPVELHRCEGVSNESLPDND